MTRYRRSALSARPQAAVAVAAAFVLLVAFAGTVLGHNTVNSATFACDGTVTWHVTDWTTDNTGNQALAPDVQVWYSLDGAPYVQIDGTFAFTDSNYLTGFGGTFSAGSATTVKIESILAPGTTWTDGDATDLGPWFSDTVDRATCESPSPSASASTTPSASPSASPSGGVEAATATPRVTPPSTSTLDAASTQTGAGFPVTLAALAAIVTLIVLLSPRPSIGTRRGRRR